MPGQHEDLKRAIRAARSRQGIRSDQDLALNIGMALIVLVLLVTNFGLGLIALLLCALIALKLGRSQKT